MKIKLFKFIASCSLLFISVNASAQIDFARGLSALSKTAQALTISDAKMAEYVKESVQAMDKQNKISPENSKYTKRLKTLTKGVTEADGIPLNFKVYEVTDVNAFACPDGSVRVFSALMDIMDDDELMGIIGHEIGHVMKHHSKNAFKRELLTGAAKDAIGAASSKVARLTDSQLGALGQSFMTAKYSQKQEYEADNCGYDFLVANGRNPYGMVKSFEKLQQLEGNGGSTASYFQKMFSSHPDTKKRIKAMEKRCKKDGYTRP